MWNVESRGLIATLEGLRGRVLSAAWSPDGERIITGGADGKVRIWDANIGQELIALGIDAAEVTQVTMDPQGRRIACGREDGTITIWTAPARKDSVNSRGGAEI